MKYARRHTSLNCKNLREFYCNNNDFNKIYNFSTNEIKTSKYSLQNFLPKSLLLQFTKLANCYFLLIAIFQCIPQISPLSPFSAIAPFTIVIGLSIIKEGIEDRVRHKSDNESNSQKSIIFQNGEWKEIKWYEIKVGNIIKIIENEVIPADIIVFESSHEQGNCFIETSSLDGEKNLKPKTVPKSFLGKYKNLPIRIEGKFIISNPNSNLNDFSGLFKLYNENIKLEANNFLVRGSKLRNTKWVFGLVMYTGIDTKIMRNSEKAKLKKSKIDKQTNSMIVIVFLFQIALCLICSLMHFSWNFLYQENYDYFLPNVYDSSLEGFLAFFTYFLLNNTMIPISLVVSLEFVKIIQAKFIVEDEDFYSINETEKNKSITVFSSSLNEELGRIQYIFSDKTGTLTCNKMEFKCAIIGLNCYGDRNPGKIKNDSEKLLFKKFLIFQNFENIMEMEGKQINLSFADNYNNCLYNINTEQELIHEYLLILSTCHECVVDNSNKNSCSNYQGPSPDEIALLDAAREMGYSFVERSQNTITIMYKEERLTFELYKLFEFNSDRKRMSIIIKHNDVIKILIKGADNIILQRLNKKVNQPFLKHVIQKLEEFSINGFRTLCIAMKIISEENLKEFLEKMENAQNDTEKNELINILESDLYLIGATAVEDKLQDMVPETIRDLLMAGIKLWMLTGDKLETAENIAKSCNLFTSNMIIFNLSKPNTQLSIEDIKSEIQFKIETINNRIYEMNINNEKKGLILDGATLCYILVDYKLMKMFAHMIENIESVVCCRVTPKQKADIVFIVKFFLQKITLSVGDGANDVNMIQEADIGVGIYGQEGIRAVQSSDFAIAEFKSLWKLILVHGRWSYLRIAEMVLYFFYKNMVFTIPHFFYGFYCSFSGQTIFDDYYISFYNLFFTCFPLMIKAVFEQDVYYKQLNYENNNLFVEELKYVKKIYPFLYFIGPQNLLFSTEKFLSSILRGLVHGFLIFYIIFFCFENTIVSIDGHYSDIWIISITLFTAIIIVVNLQLAIYTRYWIILTWIGLIFLSFFAYFIYIWISNYISSFLISYTAIMLYKCPIFYFSLVLSCSIILSVEYCIRLYLTNKETVEKYFYEMVEQEKTKSIIKRNEEKIQFKMQNLSFKKSLKLVNTLNLSDNNKDISPSKSFSIAPNDLTFKAFLS